MRGREGARARTGKEEALEGRESCEEKNADYFRKEAANSKAHRAHAQWGTDVALDFIPAALSVLQEIFRLRKDVHRRNHSLFWRRTIKQ